MPEKYEKNSDLPLHEKWMFFYILPHINTHSFAKCWHWGLEAVSKAALYIVVYVSVLVGSFRPEINDIALDLPQHVKCKQM